MSYSKILRSTALLENKNILARSLQPFTRSVCAANWRRTISTLDSSTWPFLYREISLKETEWVEWYRKGGYHPVLIGDTFDCGRYRIVHKLGSGSSSTVWLARDNDTQRLVSLKILTAEASRKDKALELLRHLDEQDRPGAGRHNIFSITDTFTLEGPNGTHTCHVSRVGGPSIAQLMNYTWDQGRTQPLRATLRRRLAGQLAEAVGCMHSAGVVHGDISPRNVLLRLTSVDTWSLDEAHRQLGHPDEREQVFRLSGEGPGIHAPNYLVQPTSFYNVEPKNFTQDMVLIDLGQAFLSPPPTSEGFGSLGYASPELLEKWQASKWSDIWALISTIFEMRCGFPPGSYSGIVYDSRALEHWVHVLEQVEQRLSDKPPTKPWMEYLGTRPSPEEIRCFADLLQTTLKYMPEERLPIEMGLKHRWFTVDF